MRFLMLVVLVNLFQSRASFSHHPFSACKCDTFRHLKHTATLFALPDHYILNGEFLLTKYRPIIMVGLWYYNQSGVAELLIMRDLHYGRMCFNSLEVVSRWHFKWVEIIQIWQNESQRFWNLADWCHILISLCPYRKGNTQCWMKIRPWHDF